MSSSFGRSESIVESLSTSTCMMVATVCTYGTYSSRGTVLYILTDRQQYGTYLRVVSGLGHSGRPRSSRTYRTKYENKTETKDKVQQALLRARR